MTFRSKFNKSAKAPYDFISFANATDRLNGAGYDLVAEDVGKICVQEDDNSHWILMNHDPITWDIYGPANATQTERGLMSAADKTALDNVTAGNVYTDVRNETGVTIPKGTLVYATDTWYTPDDCPQVDKADKRDGSKRPAIGVTHEDLLTGTTGRVLKNGTLHDIDTSAWEVTDQLMLGDDGAFQRPPPDDYTEASDTQFEGEIQGVASVTRKDAVNGHLSINIGNLEVFTADQSYELSEQAGWLNGIATATPNVWFVLDGGAAKVRVNSGTDPGVDLPFMIAGKKWLLDVTSGPGPGPDLDEFYAEATLAHSTTPGESNVNWIYIELVGGTTPTLKTSLSYPVTGPTAQIVILGYAGVLPIGATIEDTVVGFQLWDNSPDLGDSDGFASYLTQRLRQLGASWQDGVDGTLDIDDTGGTPYSVNMTFTTGLVWQLQGEFFAFPAGTTGTEYYVLNAPYEMTGYGSPGTQSIYKITDWNEITHSSDGTEIQNQDMVHLIVLGGQMSPSATGYPDVPDRIFINLPEKPYTNSDGEAAAVADTYGYANTSVAAGTGLRFSAFLLAGVVLEFQTGGVWLNTYDSVKGTTGGFIDLRGNVLGASGGGSGAGGGGGYDPNAIHTNESNEINSIPLGKSAVVAADRMVIEDSENSWDKRYVEMGDAVIAHAIAGTKHTASTLAELNALISDATLIDVRDDTMEPTGFTDPEGITVTYNPGSRTVTLTGNVKALWQGEVVSALVDTWESPAHGTGISGGLFLYYDGSTFQWSPTAWAFSDLQIAFVLFRSDQQFLVCLREVHGLMPWQSHKEFHDNLGTYRSTGGDVTGITLNEVTPALRRPLVSACTIHDEDIPTTVTAITTTTDYTRLHLIGGSGGLPTPSYNQTDIVPLNGTLPQWNENVAGTWQLTDLGNNDYMSVWLVAYPASSEAGSQDFRFIWVTGQSQSITQSAQQNLTPADVDLSEVNIATEFVFLEQIIIQETDSNDWHVVEQIRLTGSRYNQTATPGIGDYLTSVSSDATLTGDGTVGTPLGVVYGTTADTACEGDDARLSDARTPTAHATSHQDGGADEINVGGLSGVLADPQTPTAHNTSHQDGGADEINVGGLSGTLADPQTPTSHATSHQNGGADEVATATPAANAIPKAGAGGDLDGGWITYGTGASTACEGNDSRLSDARTPTAHAASHEDGGADEISVAGLSGLLATAQTPTSHASSHQDGGADEINVTGLSGLLANDQTITVEKEGTDIGSRYRMNFFDGDNATVGVVDNPAGQEVQVTVNGPTMSKSITIESPASGDDITMFFTDVALTITQINLVSTGTSPSTVWTLKSATDRSAAGTTNHSGTSTSTTGEEIASGSITQTAIAAGAYVWLELGTSSGTNVTFHVTITYTET